MRIDFRPTDPREDRGPYADEPSAADRFDVAPHVPNPNAWRMIDDPFAEYLDATGACRECRGRTAHAGSCSIIGGRGYRTGLPPLHSTVGKRDATGDVALGIVVSFARSTTPPDSVSVEWDETPADGYGVTYEDVADLLTEYGTCSLSGVSAGPNACGEPTAPGFDQCDEHGGRSPLRDR